jgi:hypothetical protein
MLLPGRIWRTILLITITLTLLAPPGAANPQTTAGVKPAMDKTARYLLAQEKTQEQPLSPWSYIALAGAGQDLAGSRVQQSCEQQFSILQPDDELNYYSLLVLTLLAAGCDPYDYKGQNLVEKIRAAQLPDGKFADNIDRSGAGSEGEQVLLNAHVWAILALYASGAEAPAPDKARQWLVNQQHPGGSFNWNGKDDKPDVDSTGMALTALGVLGEGKDSPAVQKAVAYLQNVQENNGAFASWGAVSPESCRFVIEGLIAVGIDPAGEEWTKPGGNTVSAMMGYQLPDGSFEHIKGTGSNPMATEQALIGLSDIYYGNTVIDRLRSKNNGRTQARRVVTFKPGEYHYEVNLDGQKLVQEIDAAPFLQNDRTFVPVRYLALALGVPEQDIKWSPASQTVNLVYNGVTLTLAVGENIMRINDQPLKMDVAPLLVPPGRAFLPARYVAEAFGYKVHWNEQEQSVVITGE